MIKRILLIGIILISVIFVQLKEVKGERNTYTLQIILNDYFNESLAEYPLDVILKSNTTEVRKHTITGQVIFNNLTSGSYIITVYASIPISGKIVYNGSIDITCNTTIYIKCTVMKVKILIKTVDNKVLTDYTLKINNHIYGNGEIILPIYEKYSIKAYYDNKELPLLNSTIEITPSIKTYYLICNARLRTTFEFNYYDGSSIPSSILKTISAAILSNGKELPLLFNSSSNKFFIKKLLVLGRYSIKIFYRGVYLETFDVQISSADIIILNIPLLREAEVKISDRQGKGIPYAYIRLEWENKIVWEGVTDSLGRIIFNNIPKGKKLKVIVKVGEREYTLWKSFNNPSEEILINLFSLKLTFSTPEKTRIPSGAKIIVKYNGRTFFCYEYTSGDLILDYLSPGTYEVAVYWRNTLVAYDRIVLNSNIEKNIICKIYNLTIIVKNIQNKYLNRIKIKVSSENGFYQEIIPSRRVVLLSWLPYGEYSISITYIGNFSKIPLINETILLESSQVISFVLPFSSLAIDVTNYWGERLSDVSISALIIYNNSLVDKYNMTSVTPPVHLEIIPKVRNTIVNITVIYKRFKRKLSINIINTKSENITIKMNEVFIEILDYPLNLFETALLIIVTLALVAGICWFTYSRYLSEYEEVEIIEEEDYEEEEENEYEY